MSDNLERLQADVRDAYNSGNFTPATGCWWRSWGSKGLEVCALTAAFSHDDLTRPLPNPMDCKDVIGDWAMRKYDIQKETFNGCAHGFDGLCPDQEIPREKLQTYMDGYLVGQALRKEFVET